LPDDQQHPVRNCRRLIPPNKPLSTEPPQSKNTKQFMAANPDLQAVEFLLVDPNGVMRGKWAPADSLKKAFQEGVNFPMSIHGLDIWGREVAETGLHIETGDRDGFFRAVPGTLSRVPWANRPTAQVLLQRLYARRRTAALRLPERAGADHQGARQARSLPGCRLRTGILSARTRYRLG
jgi:hypothetical protein